MSDTQRWILGGFALAGVILAAILILPGVFDAKRATDARVAREHAVRVAAEKRRLTREQRPMRGRPAGLRPPGPTASASEQLAARQQPRDRAGGRDPHRCPVAREVRASSTARSRASAVAR